MKPIVGVIGRIQCIDNRVSFYMSEKIRSAIIKSGAIPLLIVPTNITEYVNLASLVLTDDDKKDLNTIVGYCDAIVIPGTNKLYDYDKYIYEYALNLGIPILGICGGMQLMGITNNHKEYLVKINSDVDHNIKDAEYVHNIIIKKGTKLYDIIGKNKITVNSRHSMCLNNVDDFIISSHSEDGIIESIESKSGNVIGVQWHPESNYECDENSKKIFKYLIKACKE